MGEATESNFDGVRDATAAAVAPDPVTADLLAKHNAGEKLTPQEYGKISWVGRKFPWLAEKFGVKTGPPKPAAPAGDAAPVAARPEVEASPGGLAPVPIDSGFVERTTTAILNRTDKIAVRVVGNYARRAAAPITDETKRHAMVARFERAAALSGDDKELLAELTPACAQAMGVDLRQYPLAVAASVLGLYVTDLTLLVLELRDLVAKQEEKSAPPAPAAAPAATPPAALPDPSRPPNAPAIVHA